MGASLSTQPGTKVHVNKLFLLAALLLTAPATAQAQGHYTAPTVDEHHAPGDGGGLTPLADEPALDLSEPVFELSEETAPEAEEEAYSRTYVSYLCPPALAGAPAQAGDERPGFKWKAAFNESMLFLGVQHGFRMTELKTRRELPGPFFRDYFDSLKTLGGWADGGRQFTNYVAHPMQGAIYGFIQIQNDPAGKRQRFGGSKEYWKSRMRAMGWAAIWSTQFELGPLSQASIGNVGLSSKKLTYVDIVITPTMGTGWVVAEDILDRWVVERVVRGTDNRFVKAVVSMTCTPMRSVANFLRFKPPWSRD